MRTVNKQYDNLTQRRRDAEPCRLALRLCGSAGAFMLFVLVSHRTFAYDGYVDGGKNVVAATFGERPVNWDYGFRKYGATSDMLWTDPSAQRNVKAVGAAEKYLTSVAVTCDEDGFAYHVRCSVPELRTFLAATNDYPMPMIEHFYCPGDADFQKPIYQRMGFFFGVNGNKEFPLMIDDRNNRNVTPYLTVLTKEEDGAITVSFRYDWAAEFDHLPVFSKKTDNFWRLSVISWAAGGLTWGGVVQQPNQAGYIRWPDFTDAQKLAILRRTLAKGWTEFRRLSRDLSHGTTTPGYPYVKPGKFYQEELKANPRSYTSMNEDPGFRPVLKRIEAERDALGPQIEQLAEMSSAELEVFYRKAADLLFNYKYDVQKAYGEYQKNLLMEGK